jgi:hypothetical protein
MEFKADATEWLRKTILPMLIDKYQVKEKYLENSDFGECLGLDFESDTRTGYIYLWATHMLGFGIFDLKNNEMLVEQEFVEFTQFGELQKLSASFMQEL